MRQPCKKYTSLPLTFALSVSLCQPKTPLAVLPHVGEAGLKDDTNSVKCLFGLNDFQTPEDQGVPLPDGPIIGKKKKKVLHTINPVCLLFRNPTGKRRLWGLLAVKPLGGR